MSKIKILDCSLRDGGYVNNWDFKDEHISKIFKAISTSNVDIIECGYLSEKKAGGTLFKSASDFDKFISDEKIFKVMMINFGDFDVLKLKNSDKIKGIRLAFHKENLNQALKAAKIIKDKGYEVFFQPMVSKRFSDIEFLKMLDLVNDLKPYAFYIVDSFGSINLREFKKFSLLANDNLHAKIALGYHSHNNMQLAFSNAINLINQHFKRSVIIDSSVYGIGRGAGYAQFKARNGEYFYGTINH